MHGIDACPLMRTGSILLISCSSSYLLRHIHIQVATTSESQPQTNNGHSASVISTAVLCQIENALNTLVTDGSVNILFESPQTYLDGKRPVIPPSV